MKDYFLCDNLSNTILISANTFLLKVNNRNGGKRCEICSKLTSNTLEQLCFFFFLFELILHHFLKILFLNLNKQILAENNLAPPILTKIHKLLLKGFGSLALMVFGIFNWNLSWELSYLQQNAWNISPIFPKMTSRTKCYYTLSWLETISKLLWFHEHLG